MTVLSHLLPARSAQRGAAMLAFVALACLGVGCSTAASGTTSDLLAAEDAPLSQVGLADVETASSSCEGLLGDVTEFAVLGETGLVVGLDASGLAVCIDTVDAVNTELSVQGRATDALDLIHRYETTMAMRNASGTGPTFRRFALAGDPDPEPNSPQYSQPSTSRPGI
ncbi:MAG: hypothetical protein K1X94_35845 [Sandaracinaceae bacterium]|nr:hypothetical protein [Sandaracinaceae bacterium]